MLLSLLRYRNGDTVPKGIRVLLFYIYLNISTHKSVSGPKDADIMP
jgi:hypothetical protein